MLIFSAFALITYMVVWAVISTSFGKVFTDLPGGRKVHQRIIPRVGGFCILIVFIPVIFLWNNLPPSLFTPLPDPLQASLLWASIGILIVGFLDDSTLFVIDNKAKLLFEFMIAVIIVFIHNVYFHQISFFNFTISDPIVMKLFSMIWIVGVTNAMNIIDGIDGLAGTVVLITLIAIGILGGLSGHDYLISISMILGGLVFGFLLHNYSPARVFFGDTGSLFFGIVIATFAIYLHSLEGLQSTFFLPLWLVGLPLMDFGVAILRRFVKSMAAGNKLRKSLAATMVADNEHIHHRLIQRGISHTLACLMLSCLAASFSIAAIFTSMVSANTTLFILFYLSIMCFIILFELDYFNRIEKKTKSWRKKATEAAAVHVKRVCIIDADEILKFSLQKYKQTAIHFTFADSYNSMCEKCTCSATIINCHKKEDFDVVLQKAVKLYKKLQIPVIIVIPEDVVFNSQDTRIMIRTISYIVKPLFIPLFLIDLTTIIKHSNNLFTQEGNLKGTTKIRAVQESR